MSKATSYRIAIAAVFVWVGFVGAISFMEAWLKFQAPGITLPLGLGIGRLVFGALNKVELVLSVIAIATVLHGSGGRFQRSWGLFLITFLLLMLQSAWLLPALDARAEIYIQGNEPPASNLHILYIIFEFIKLICLMIFGFTLFKQLKNE